MSNHPICSWQRSPLFAAMLDALTECGLHDQAEVARITDAEVWARKGDHAWPSPDKATRDRFHACWTAKVQAACGVNPDQSPAETYNAGQSDATARAPQMEAMYRAGDTTAAIAAKFGVDVRTVQKTLTRRGIDLKERLVISSSERERAVALYLEDTTRTATDVAKMLGVSHQSVSRHLRASGVTSRSINSANAMARWDAVRRLQARAEGARHVA